jgi:uridine kinase
VITSWSYAPAVLPVDALEPVADAIAALRPGHPARVAVDGPDAAGKTTIADALATILGRRGRTVVRASVDGFHRPRAERYRRGRDSPEGYYGDSFDYCALRTALLDPLGPAGDRSYRTRAFDWRNDEPVEEPLRLAPEDAVLLVDGVFLLRPELAGLWDYRIFVRVPLEECLRRALIRDVPSPGDEDAVRARYERRYLPGQRLYFDAVRPWLVADAVIDNG